MADKDKVKLIEYEGDNTVFVWKHPEENFYEKSPKERWGNTKLKKIRNEELKIIPHS